MRGQVTVARDLREVSEMERDELLERYEALGNERDFRAARPLYEQGLQRPPTRDC